MAIYLGNTLLTGGSSGGGGGSVPIGSYGTFYRADHTPNDVYEDSAGQRWLKTGQVLTFNGQGDLTDAASHHNSLVNLGQTGTLLPSYHSGTFAASGEGLGFWWNGANPVLIGAHTTTFWRFSTLDTSGPSFAQQQQFFNANVYLPVISHASTNIVWSRSQVTVGNGADTFRVATGTGSLNANPVGTTTYLSMGDAQMQNATRFVVFHSAVAGDYILLSMVIDRNVSFGGTNYVSGDVITWIINATQARAAGTVIRTQDIVGVVRGYAQTTGSTTTFRTVEDRANDVPRSVEYTLATGVSTGDANILEFTSIPPEDGTISARSATTSTLGVQDASANIRTMGLVTTDGDNWFYFDPRASQSITETAQTIANGVGDNVEQFVYIDTNGTSTAAASWTTSSAGNPITNPTGAQLRTYNAIPLYLKISDTP